MRVEGEGGGLLVDVEVPFVAVTEPFSAWGAIALDVGVGCEWVLSGRSAGTMSKVYMRGSSPVVVGNSNGRDGSQGAFDR